MQNSSHKIEMNFLAGMKISGILIVLLVLVIGISSCQTDQRQVTAELLNFPPAEGSESGDDVPLITFDSTHCHFGKMAIGEKFKHTFRFKNTGQMPLVISQVTPSCGCTTARDWPTHPVLPGEEGQISIEFDSQGFPGAIEKTITVLTNCIPKTIDLKLSGFVSGVQTDQELPDHPIDMERTK